MTKSKLKTLKDFVRVNHPREAEAIEIKELKAEAIKWVKNIRELDLESRDDILGFPEGSRFDEETIVIRWIKHFFNITGDDLK